MPAKIVDLSARSTIIEAEPFGLHFWECTPKEFLDYLKDPRGVLASMGIKLPKNCRIETTIENHEWLSANTRKLAADNGPVIVCNVGGGNVAVTRNIYRVVSYAHTHDMIGKFKKTLLHSRNEQERKSKSVGTRIGQAQFGTIGYTRDRRITSRCLTSPCLMSQCTTGIQSATWE